MSDEHDDPPPPTRTQEVRQALEKMGYSRSDNSMGLPEQGVDLAKHITSTSGVVGLLAVAMTAGLFALVWQLMDGQQAALGTVATHQTAMARRIDALTNEIEDMQSEMQSMRFVISGNRNTYTPNWSNRNGPDSETRR